MIGKNYAVGLGTCLIFAGFYMFKSVVVKKATVDKEGEVFHKKMTTQSKILLIVSAVICFVIGVILIVNELPGIKK